ncbi:hypothetical protein ABS71_12320 [bacterium SCN 62-11]|nr:MAG: hypothetical protein ABS71_12320 [bacterium SCN 62-11]
MMSLSPNPADLPEGSQLDFQRLLAFPLETPERMRIAVERHLHNVREAASEYPQANQAVARQIAEELRELLGYGEETPLLHQQWIQAAARYFFLNQDENHDWATAEGFDDDLAVVRCVARACSAVTG